MVTCVVANDFFFILKGYHNERSENRFQLLSNLKLNLPGEFTKSCKRQSLFNEPRDLTYTGWWSNGTTPVPKIISKRKSVGTGESKINVQYDSAPYNHSTAQVTYSTVNSRHRWKFISQILLKLVAHNSYLEACSSYLVACSLYRVVHSS